MQGHRVRLPSTARRRPRGDQGLPVAAGKLCLSLRELGAQAFDHLIALSHELLAACLLAP